LLYGIEEVAVEAAFDLAVPTRVGASLAGRDRAGLIAPSGPR